MSGVAQRPRADTVVHPPSPMSFAGRLGLQLGQITYQEEVQQ